MEKKEIIGMFKLIILLTIMFFAVLFSTMILLQVFKLDSKSMACKYELPSSFDDVYVSDTKVEPGYIMCCGWQYGDNHIGIERCRVVEE